MRPARYALLPLLLVLATAAGGCTQQDPQRQYNPRGPGSSVRSDVANPRTVQYPSPRAGSAYDSPSQGIATVASAVPGAGSVQAVALGNVALLGIPSPDVAVHRKVVEQVRASFAHIAEVRVTSDPAQIRRLFEAQEMMMMQSSIAPLLPDLAQRSAGYTPYR